MQPEDFVNFIKFYDTPCLQVSSSSSSAIVESELAHDDWHLGVKSRVLAAGFMDLNWEDAMSVCETLLPYEILPLAMWGRTVNVIQRG